MPNSIFCNTCTITTALVGNSSGHLLRSLHPSPEISFPYNPATNLLTTHDATISHAHVTVASHSEGGHAGVLGERSDEEGASAEARVGGVGLVVDPQEAEEGVVGARHGERVDDDEGCGAEKLEEHELLWRAEAGEEDIQFKHPPQWVTPHALPVVAPENPPRQPVEQVYRHHPAVHIHNRLDTVMRQRAQIYLSIRLPQHIRQQRNRQRRTKPHEAHKTRRDPELAHPQRRARGRYIVVNRQRSVRVEGGE
ncbi:hypothetical protein V493_03699 [Pseudogymnoascus sp. VKM F-4281 (FW-2241)]|nr:hypothetical protein V493_03699 [Pseudogymnoascus sp. VKM F-4281 (FW-2241)]